MNKTNLHSNIFKLIPKRCGNGGGINEFTF